MKKIYLKNFKGFDEKIIELGDINFLVGENSTGKSSILKIINILSSREFWFDAEFNNSEVELGYFNEIKCQNTDDDFFRIGIEIPYRNKQDKFYKRMVIEFVEKNNIPHISRLKTSVDDKDIVVRLFEKKIEFQSKKQRSVKLISWVRMLDFDGPVKRLNAPVGKFPLSLILSLIESEVAPSSRKGKGANFGLKAYPLYPNYTWLAPIRAKAKRIYENYKIKFSPEGDHVFSLLKNIYANKKSKDSLKIIRALNKYGKDSNLFDNIKVTNIGRNSDSPFEIKIMYRDMAVKLPNVGYGVAQSLPLIVEILASQGECISIQQPEVHLHPKAQAAFGQVLLYSFFNNDCDFLIETHSDFTINRFRYALSQSNAKTKPVSQILFFQRKGKRNDVIPIKIDEYGAFPKPVPSDYRCFFIDEELKLMEI